VPRLRMRRAILPLPHTFTRNISDFNCVNTQSYIHKKQKKEEDFQQKQKKIHKEKVTLNKQLRDKEKQR
jgi:hypothetical protein